MNVRDLIKYMADKHASQRSVVIHAAATAECVKPTLVMERPMYEEKNASIPVRHISRFTSTVAVDSFIFYFCYTALAAAADRIATSRGSGPAP